MDTHKRSRDEFEGDGHQAPYEEEHQFESKRQHIDPAQELINNVCKDIRRLGENPNISNQIDDVSYISNPIVAEFEKIDNLRHAILNTVYAIVIEQPQKISALANLILICNAKNIVVAKYVIEFLHARAQSLLDAIGTKEEAQKDEKIHEDAGVFNNIKSILKFLGALSPIIDNNAVVNVFKQFLSLSIELQGESSKRNGLAQAIFYNVLVAIPYLLSNEFTPEIVEKVNELVDLAKDFKIVEVSSNLLLQPYDTRLGNYNLPYEPKKIIDLILPAIIDLQGENKQWDGLKGKLFLNFSEYIDPIIKDALANNPISNELVKHQLPQLSLPSVDKLNEYKPKGLIDELWSKNSRVLFQVYNSTEFETVPRIETYFGLFFKDLSFDILTNLSFNKNEASIQLSILDLYFSKYLFAPPASSIDQLSLIHNDNVAGENLPPLSTWKIEDIAVESILTMIFQLPTTLHYEIYYYTVLISCCRESPESIAPVFGRAIRYFYNNLETLDYELKIRFLDWMTTQMSNFDFSWKWDEWVADSRKFKLLKYHPKKNFIKNLIAKEIRLSNKSTIQKSFTVTMDPETTDESTLHEFDQYLNISLYEKNLEYVIEYDSQLYGNKDEIKTVLTKLCNEKLEALVHKPAVSAQEEIHFNFSNSELPLHVLANKVYDFVVAHWQSNTAFEELYKEVLAAAEEIPEIDNERFLINLFFQTYAFVGSRSIYSVVLIISRDVNKLKFLSGSPIEYTEEEPKFSEELTEDQIADRQKWIIEAVFRIWAHQPQVVFLILEYLIEFKVLKPKSLVQKTLDLETNFIIENVSCMESFNRLLRSSYNENKDELKSLILLLFNLIVNNLNSISAKLEADDGPIEITKEFDAEDVELAQKIDFQWLFYEYKGLLKSYFRKFIKNESVDYLDEIKTVFDGINNKATRDDVVVWLGETN